MCGLLITALVCGANLTFAQDNANQPMTTPQQTQQPQTSDDEPEAPAGENAVVAPVYKDYRGVTIGMTADEARRKLGNKKADGKTQDFFQIEDDEMVSLYYTKDGKVRANTIIYTGKNAPADTAVVGATVAPDANEHVHKLIRYPHAGYWVAYQPHEQRFARRSGHNAENARQRTRVAAAKQK